MKNPKPISQDPELINFKKEKLQKYDIRGVQTLFRTLSRNHYNLLKMIDNKARIMLTVNSLMVSLLIGSLSVLPNLGDIHMIVTARILVISSLASLIFAIISMLPYKYLGNEFKKSNYKGTLYAENFSKLSLSDFKIEIDRIMMNGQSIYDEMVEDLYFLGKTIAKKQSLLLISFALFLIGIVTSLLYAFFTGILPLKAP
nr:Pycsar system effector family protein [Allomuricauda sp.]